MEVRASRGRHTPDARRLLVAYSGSPASARAIERAAELALDGGEVVVLNVVPVQSVSSRLQTVSDKQRERQSALLAEGRAIAQRKRAHVSTVAAAGDVCAEIIRVAREQHADTIVVGGPHDPHHLQLHTPLSRRLVRSSPVDVLVVR